MTFLHFSMAGLAFIVLILLVYGWKGLSDLPVQIRCQHFLDYSK